MRRTDVPVSPQHMRAVHPGKLQLFWLRDEPLERCACRLVSLLPLPLVPVLLHLCAATARRMSPCKLLCLINPFLRRRSPSATYATGMGSAWRAALSAMQTLVDTRWWARRASSVV